TRTDVHDTRSGNVAADGQQRRDKCDRYRVACRNWQQRQEDNRPALAVQAKRDSKQPSHRGVKAVEGPKSRRCGQEPPVHSSTSMPGQQLPRAPLSGTKISWIAIRIRRAIAAFEPNLVRSVRSRPFDEELLIEGHAAFWIGVELDHPTLDAVGIELRINGA